MSDFLDEDHRERDWIVDTNVLIVANGSTEDVGLECRENCIELLEAATDGEVVVVVDSDFRIIGEYNKQQYLQQPGPGQAFLKWILRNRSNPKHCVRVDLTETPSNPLDFEEFPDHEELQDFDNDDRKFVAVAHAHNRPTAICEAVDTDWWGWKEALEEVGVAVIFPCEEHMKTQWEAEHADD